MQRCRLDRFIGQNLAISRRDVRMMLAQKRVKVNDEVASDIGLIVDKFSKIIIDDILIQEYTPRYIMLHKPVGVVCATIDDKHKTVLDLLPQALFPEKDDLHLVGRLDLNTSGLVLITNDSQWSQKLTHPEHKVEKHYIVTLQNPLTEGYVDAFKQGMYFEYEDITTQPAQLVVVSENIAKVVLTEGRYHQIKRMFGRFRNPVVGLHREQIGTLKLDSLLAPGMFRELTSCEVDDISVK